ncbi:MAG: DUF4044 domain-containing protein [Clostridiales bacterium]|nr:DUF4044 domain-containing protein [Clostridiales bacterium]
MFKTIIKVMSWIFIIVMLGSVILGFVSHFLK